MTKCETCEGYGTVDVMNFTPNRGPYEISETCGRCEGYGWINEDEEDTDDEIQTTRN